MRKPDKRDYFFNTMDWGLDIMASLLTTMGGVLLGMLASIIITSCIYGNNEAIHPDTYCFIWGSALIGCVVPFISDALVTWKSNEIYRKRFNQRLNEYNEYEKRRQQLEISKFIDDCKNWR